MVAKRRIGTDRPTIIDVANMAGVSRQTVSRVVSDHPRVADATRTRVKEAIDTLGYRPNRMARALVTKSTLTFGFAAVDMRDLHFGDTCSGMQVAAREHGYYLVVTELDFDDEGGIGTLETLLTLGVDGVALFPSFLADEDIEAFAATSGCPVVMIGRESRIPNVVSIAMDEVRAAEMIVDRFIDVGKQHIGILMNETYPEIILGRFVALRQAVEDRTGVVDPPVVSGFPKIRDGRDAATRLLQQHPEVDALIGFNDTMAMGAMLACHDLGLRIPQDVAVIGYDGIPFGAVSNPPLTSIVQDSIGMADAAFRSLLSCLEKGTPAHEGEVQVWTPELLIRESA
jgi:DNA-binding LacI/PurR family transcriptional regulator